MLKVVHAYQCFLDRTKFEALSYESMEYLEVPCVKGSEVFCLLDCNTFTHLFQTKMAGFRSKILQKIYDILMK